MWTFFKSRGPNEAATAAEIIAAARAEQAAKTARLREARLAKEAADLLEEAPPHGGGKHADKLTG